MEKQESIRTKIRNDFSILKWALKSAWEIDKKTLMSWSFVGILGSLMPVFFVSITKKIVDIISISIQNQSGFSVIVLWIGALTTFLFFNALYEIFPEILSFTMHSIYSIGMQKRVGEWIKTLPIRLFDDPDMTTKMNMTMPTIRWLGFFMQNLIRFLSSVIGIIGILVLALNNSVILFVVGLILTCISLPIGFYNAIASHRLWRDEGNNKKISEYYYGLVFDHTLAREYRTLNLDKFIRQKWNDIVRPMNLRSINQEQKNEFRWNLLALINMIFKFVAIFIGLNMVSNGDLTLGGIVLFVSVFDQISNASTKMGRQFMGAYRFLKDLGFQQDLLSLDFSHKKTLKEKNCSEEVEVKNAKYEEQVENFKAKEQVEFELKNVSYSYDNNKRQVLKNISMKINKGETVALVGNNGAGKSTLIKLLLGFYAPTEGAVYFEGKNYNEVDFKKLVNKMGVTFQDYAKFEFTLRENIAFGDISKLGDDEALLAACKKGGVDKILNRMDGDLDAYIGRWYKSKGTNFSGGEWQRIATSRAYLSEREILIMDEPASALDPIAEMEQFNNIRSTLKDRTAILISHRIGFARLADKIAVLKDAELVEFGTHDELMSLKGTYFDMFISQAEWYSKEEAI